MTIYSVKPIAEIEPALLDGMNTDGFDYAVMRVNGRGQERPWSFHKGEKNAKAAVRRNRSRDVVTR